MVRPVRALRLAAWIVCAGLAGCTSAGTQPVVPAALAAPAETAAAPVAVEPVAISIAPITGVPADWRFAMRDMLKNYALSRKLTVVDDDDPTAVYRLKGRVSAVGTGEGTYLVYKWTVSDAAGQRLHSFSGQQSGAGSDSDPWAGIGGSQVDEAARDTIDTLADWIRRTGAPKPLQ